MARFRAKARAVELLGKGQIADLPTAISELWKNGYDAYAKNLICNLYLDSYKDNKSPIFLLSDDGFGMSKTDILEKWFVLGTDSKARNERIESDFGLKKRIPMGEKGIGRLSVSYLGSIMLMITKKGGGNANAFLMDWRVLENYDFFLEDLNIPLFTFHTLEEFHKQIKIARKEFMQNFSDDLWPEQNKLKKEVLDDWSGFTIPDFINDDIIQLFCDDEYHGTSFIIFTPTEQLLEISQQDQSNEAIKYIKSSLSGLHNDLKDPSKDFETHFYIYDASGKYDSINEFFTQEEMCAADHWLKGEFDKNGLFTGEIRIFNLREKYSFRPNRPPGKTPYGPLRIQWGALEGNSNNSMLNEEKYHNFERKLDTFGGLYVYRDNFRVLPYGRTEYDFLHFEERRSFHAGKYFFSHRRFIGYLDLSRKTNPKLKDKAGREGFIENKAYRELKSDLIEFFIDIAARYMQYGKDNKYGTFRETQIEEIKEKHKKQDAALKRKNKKTKTAFLANLNGNKERIKSLFNDINIIKDSLNKESSYIEINYNSYNKLLEQLDFKKRELRILKVQKPHGIKVTKRQEKTYEEYQNDFYLTETVVKTCESIVDKTREKINVENLKLEFNDKYKSHIKYIEKQFSLYQETTKESFHRILGLLKTEESLQIEAFVEQVKGYSIKGSDQKENISSKIISMDRLAEEHKRNIDDSFGGFVKHITNLQIDVDDDFLRGWFQEQNENLQEKLGDYEELAQLGMTIEIIDHQFNVMYSQMNDAVKEIGKYFTKDENYQYNFKQLKNAFQHLEGNYKLLRPLYRTSRRSRDIITGAQLETYIETFFKSEFSRYNIQFEVSEAFKAYEFFTFDSIIKPVFINIINNANYWLISSESRKIKIELIDDEILIMNSGKRIDDSQLEDIFTLFYTRKRDGRGIGLYLAKKHLRTEGYDIRATNERNYNKLNGACFIISKTK